MPARRWESAQTLRKRRGDEAEGSCGSTRGPCGTFVAVRIRRPDEPNDVWLDPFLSHDRKNVLRAFRTIVERANQSERESAEKANAEPDLISASLRFHDLRHTHASCSISAAHSIKAVSRRLGHASIEITLRVYAHLMPNDDEKLTTGVEASSAETGYDWVTIWLLSNTCCRMEKARNH